MAEISTRQIEQLQEAFTRPERLSDGAMLAGGALALPLLAVRRRQAGVEAVRTERRLGRDHPQTKLRQAQAQALATREAELRGEVSRQQLHKPMVGEQAGLYGRVTRRGEAVPGVAVAALDEKGESLAHSCTGNNGDYMLAFTPDVPVLIEVRDDKRRLFRDEIALAYPPFRAMPRDVELSRAKPPCPDNRPAGPGGRVQMPSLVGRRDEEAVRILDGLGLRVGKRATKRGAEAGIVLDHQPGAGATVEAGSAVDLVISAGDDRPAGRIGDLTGKSLHQAIEEVRAAGAELGTVTVSTDGGRTPIVREARPAEKGQKVDVDVSTSAGDAQLMGIVATVIGTSAEAAALRIEGAPATAEWLRKHSLTSLEGVTEVQSMSDDDLRKRMKLKREEPLEPVRALLTAGISRVRKV